MRKILEKILYSFPIQLVLVHVRKNFALVLLWVLFIAIISGNFGRIYGVHFLFLDPEYLNDVGFLSFFIIGICYGNLVTAFNITCYILESHRFPFIGILELPFSKFSINNSLIPVISLFGYMGFIVRFQLQNEYSSVWQICIDITGLLIGITVVILVFYFYFRSTNKDIFKYLTGSVDKTLRKSKINRSRVLARLQESKERYQVRSYLDLKLRVRSCDSLQDFYDKTALVKVFDQNHLNSVIIELVFVVLILGLGFFMENTFFQIPAAASVFLMLAILVMIIGAVSYWFKGWSTLVVLVCFLILNFSVKIGLLKGIHEAKGLNYDILPAEYQITALEELNSDSVIRSDSLHMIKILDSWKKNQQDDVFKPIFICVSGGGQRAALWTLNGLIQSDSALNGTLMNRSMLITGASGGMIGAAYYRELFRSKSDLPKEKMLANMGKDNLNAIIFSLLVNDAFFKVRKFEYAKKTYQKDRGYVFESNLNNNLDNVFEMSLSDYQSAESAAKIPMLLMSPVIANDGRSLYISSTSMSFMNEAAIKDNTGFKIKGIGLNQLFKDHGAEDLSFLTALRMSASFPYITPTISLPTNPKIEVMDAGIADNYGVSDAVRFLAYFNQWFELNTEEVTMLVIRDSRKNAPIEPPASPSITDRFTDPISNVYNNLGNIQDINNDDLLESLIAAYKVPIRTVQLEYNTYSTIDVSYLIEAKAVDRKQLERASLSWHLTTKEKENIIENIYLPNNKKALNELVEIYKSNE